MASKQNLSASYNPKEFEDEIFSFWEQNNLFSADENSKKPPYTIVMPPPNVTGVLHMGHALDNTLQDILIRYHRMAGYNALWVPGTDHASIATEAKIVEAMRKEGVSKADIGRDKFLQRAWAWTDKYGGAIISQVKKLGCSCDFSRQRFTLDEGCSNAVHHVFTDLYDKGLIYRGERIVNWCTDCKTTISDAEVVYEESEGKFYHIKYPLENSDEYLIVATTRPETLLGDTAVAVNPNDERYTKFVGKNVVLPLVNRIIPVVADDYVDVEFGSGVVKITPAHDPNDFLVGERHNLPIINVMNEDGTINKNGGEYCSLDRFEARKKIIEDLKKANLLLKIEPHKHNVGHCYRCKSIIEPYVSKQWFVSMEKMAKASVDAVKKGDTKFVPPHFANTFYHWMENCKDWCISRQLWWGHRIPAYYCSDCDKISVGKDLHQCSHCNSENIKQDEDTLDTWFSSALWPFSTLGWPENSRDFEVFYPTSTLVTGYDIIFFWVARMIFSAIEQTGKTPFDTVFIHGIVRDKNGDKMSKSKGNGVDPLTEIDKFGADALRFMLAQGTAPGNDMRYTEDKIEAGRNFANKVFNAAKFIEMNTVDIKFDNSLPNELLAEDKWILTHLNDTAKRVNENIKNFDLGVALTNIYDFLWDDFCDWYVEISKISLYGDDENLKNSKKQVLLYVFSKTLALLHPFMPFLTEKIWQSLQLSENALIITDYPVFDEKLDYKEQAIELDAVIDLIRAIRQRRAELNVVPKVRTDLYIATANQNYFTKAVDIIKKLGYANEIHIKDEFTIDNATSALTDLATVYIKLDELIDKKEQEQKLLKELKICEDKLEFNLSKLNNKGFTDKAPENVIKKVQEEADSYKAKIENIKAELEKLK